MLAALAIVSALFRRERQGGGARLDISMAQAALQLMWPEVAKVSMDGKDTPRVGYRGFSGSPGAATFACADGWISIAANTPVQFRALCAALGLPDLTQDAVLIDQAALQGGGFVSGRDPVKVHAMLGEAIRRQTAQALEAALTRQAVPCAALRPLSAVLPDVMNHPRMTLPVRSTSYPAGVMRDLGAGYLADRDAGTALAAAPRLGQHTREILQSLQVSEDDIAQLAQAGAIRLDALTC